MRLIKRPSILRERLRQRIVAKGMRFLLSPKRTHIAARTNLKRARKHMTRTHYVRESSGSWRDIGERVS